MQKVSKVPTLSELQLLSPNLKAIFWDMDGTLINTEILHEKAIFSVIKKLCLNNEATKELVACKGVTDHEIYLRISPYFTKPVEFIDYLKIKDEFFISLTNQAKTQDILSPQVLELIKEASEKKIHLALVTSSERNITDLLLDFMNLKHFFSLIITREDTDKNKPAPEPYLKALENSTFTKEECLIMEDSEVGMQAATSAQIKFVQAKWY